VSAPTTTEDLVEQIREGFAQAQAAGQPLPGRPTLAKLTGATDYRVRVALEQLARTDPGTGGADDGSDGGPGENGDPDFARTELAGEIIANAEIDGLQLSASGDQPADERPTNRQPPVRPGRWRTR
jgi:hypothetical protein